MRKFEVLRNARDKSLDHAVAEVVCPTIQMQFGEDEWQVIRAAARMKGMTPMDFVYQAIMTAARKQEAQSI